MLEIIDIGIEHAVAFRVSGKISKMDMQVVLDDVQQKIDRFGCVVIYEQVESLKGVAFGAMLEKLKYAIKEGYADVMKIAVLTDKPWMRKVASLQNRLVRKIEIQSFALDQQADAIAFLQR